MTSLSKISPLGHVNYAIKSLLNTKTNLEKAIVGLPKDAPLKKMLAVIEGVLPMLEKKSRELYAIKRPYHSRVRPPQQLGYTLDDALDSASIVADPLRKRVRTMIEIVIEYYGIDYATLTSGRKQGRIAQSKKALAIGLKEYMGLPSQDVRRLLSVSANTVDYHVRTQIPQDTALFRESFTKLSKGEYNFEH